MQKTDFHEQIMRMRGPQTLKNFFLSEKKLLNAILGAKLKYMKMFLSNEMNSFFAMQKTDFMSKSWECEAHRRSKTSFSVRKVAKCNFKSKDQVHEKCFFLMKWTVFCNAEDRFSWANHENARPTDAQKLLSQWEKLLNAILRAKIKYMKNVSF